MIFLLKKLKSYLTIPFISLSLVFNFNIIPYAYAYEKVETKNVYKLEFNESNLSQFKIKNNYIYTQDIYMPNIENQIGEQLVNGTVYGVLFSLVGCIIGGAFNLIGLFFRVSDANTSSLIFSSGLYLTMSYGITISIMNFQKDNEEGNWWGTYLGAIGSILTLLLGSLLYTNIDAQLNLNAPKIFDNALYKVLFILLLPIYMAIGGTIGYHISKKEIRVKNEELLYNQKDFLAKFEENYKKITENIIIDKEKISFSIIKF